MEKTMDGVEAARLIAAGIGEVDLFNHGLETCMRWMKKHIVEILGFWRRAQVKKMQLPTVDAWRLVVQSAWQMAFEDEESVGAKAKKTLVWKMCQYMHDPCTGTVHWGEDWRHVNIWDEVQNLVTYSLRVQNEVQIPCLVDYNAAAWRATDLHGANHHHPSATRTGADWTAMHGLYDQFHGDYAQSVLGEAEAPADWNGQHADRFGRTWSEHNEALWDATHFLQALAERGQRNNADMKAGFRLKIWPAALFIIDHRVLQALADAPRDRPEDAFAYLADEQEAEGAEREAERAEI